MKRAIIYARVSGDDRHREGRNLQSQITDGRQYCQEKGHRIVAELAEDDRGASGADWDLPMLNQALGMARAGEFDVLVVRELDRLARGLAKQLVVEGEFRRHGVEIEYVLADYPNTPEGNLMKNVRAVVAEYERLKTTERMTRGRRNVVKSGKPMLHGNAGPYGYHSDVERDDQGRIVKRRLIIYEPEAKIVRQIFTWYVEGDETGKRLSIRAIAKKLTNGDVPTWSDTREGGFADLKTRKHGQWSHSSVADILGNEVYCGLWHYGKKTRAREEWLPLEVPAIVCREVWEKAQQRKAKNKRALVKSTKHNYLMGGRVTCGHCNSKMAGKPATPWKGKQYYYYYCPAAMGNLADCECDTKYFNAEHVDNAVWRWVKEILQHPDQLRAKLERRREEVRAEIKPLYERAQVIDDLLIEHRRKLEKALDLYLSGDFDREILTERKARLEATIAELEKEQAVITAWGYHITQGFREETIAGIEALAQRLARELDAAELDFATQRQLIDDLGIEVTLVFEDGQRVAHVRCSIGEERALPLSTDLRRGCCAGTGNQASTHLPAR